MDRATEMILIDLNFVGPPGFEYDGGLYSTRHLWNPRCVHVSKVNMVVNVCFEINNTEIHLHDFEHRNATVAEYNLR